MDRYKSNNNTATPVPLSLSHKVTDRVWVEEKEEGAAQLVIKTRSLPMRRREWEREKEGIGEVYSEQLRLRAQNYKRQRLSSNSISQILFLATAPTAPPPPRTHQELSYSTNGKKEKRNTKHDEISELFFARKFWFVSFHCRLTFFGLRRRHPTGSNSRHTKKGKAYKKQQQQ